MKASLPGVSAASRDRFEAWLFKTVEASPSPLPKYCTTDMWAAWQAAESAALELADDRLTAVRDEWTNKRAIEVVAGINLSILTIRQLQAKK